MATYSRIPWESVLAIEDPWLRLAWAILCRAIADLRITGRKSSAECYLRSQRAGCLMEHLGVDQGQLLASHNLT